MRLMPLSIYVAFACISVTCLSDSAAQKSKLLLTANNRGASGSYVKRPPPGDNGYNTPSGGFANGYAWGYGFQRTGNGNRIRGLAYGSAAPTMNNLINQIEKQTIGVPIMDQVLRNLQGNAPVPRKRP